LSPKSKPNLILEERLGGKCRTPFFFVTRIPFWTSRTCELLEIDKNFFGELNVENPIPKPFKALPFLPSQKC